MDGSPRNLAFLVILTLATIGASGCQWMRQWQNPYPGMTPAWTAAPTREQVIQVVNQNNSRIRSFSTSHAQIKVPGAPTIQASIAMERPNSFRLVADSPLTPGPELDLGSNSELFWFWYRNDPRRATYFCRHDRFAQVAARNAIPIAPSELIDAFGLAQFDPALVHQGPVPGRDGSVTIRTIRQTAEGPATKVTVVNAYGMIVQQQIFDARGQLVINSISREPYQDPATGLVMAKNVMVNCPPSGMSMQITLNNLEVNRLAAGPDLWTMPNNGAQLVDLSDPSLQLAPMTTVQSSPPNVGVSNQPNW